MIRLKLISKLLKALYHDGRNVSDKRLQWQQSQGDRKTKMPTIRYASNDPRHKLKRIRLDSEDALIISSRQAEQTIFKPFPYLIDENNKAEVAKRLFSPLHDVPYSKQLTLKEEQCRKFLRILAKDLIASGTKVRIDVSHLPCPVRPIVSAPVQRSYRNMEDLSIWAGINGKPTIGLFAFKPSLHGNTIALDISDLEITSDIIKDSIKVLQNIIDTRKNFPIFNPRAETEHGYRGFQVRCNLKNELMVLASFNPANLLQKELEDEKCLFKNEILSKFQEAGLQLNSVGFQAYVHSHSRPFVSPYDNLHGPGYLAVTINDFNLRHTMNNLCVMSLPNANSYYSTIEQSINQCFPIVRNSGPVVVNLMSTNSVLDFHLSRYGSQVIGINLCAHSVFLANEDAKTNNVMNIQFEYAEHRLYDSIIAKIISGIQQEMMVVIEVAKWRNMISNHVIDMIRSCKRITKVVFVAGKLDSKSNEILMKLCQIRRNLKGLPFVPVSASPIDTSPQTPHYLTLVMLERSQ